MCTLPELVIMVAVASIMTDFDRAHIELFHSICTMFLSKIEVEIKVFESFTLKITKNGCHGNSIKLSWQP